MGMLGTLTPILVGTAAIIATGFTAMVWWLSAKDRADWQTAVDEHAKDGPLAALSSEYPRCFGHSID